MQQIRILLADESFLFREGIKSTLKTHSEIEIIGEASGGDQLQQMAYEYRPDIIVFEINLCEKPVNELINEIRTVSPFTKFMIVSDCDCGLPVFISIKAGLHAFLKKSASKEELTHAINTISTGGRYFTPTVMNAFFSGFDNMENIYTLFTDRELEILRYIRKGRSSEQIADIISLSEKTVATHKRNIMKKAGVKRTSDLILWAIDNGFNGS